MIKGHLHKDNQKIRFELPQDWNEVTLKQLEQLSGDKIGPLDLFAALSGLDLDLVKQCRAEEVSFIIDQMNDLFDTDKITNLKELVEQVELNGEMYNITTDLLNMPSGQWYDVKKIEQLYQEEPIKGVRHILSMLIIKEGEEYSYPNSKKTYELLANLDVETAYKIRGFFLTRQFLSLNNLKASSVKSIVRKNLKLVMIRLAESMVAFLRFTILQKITRFFQRFMVKRKR